MNKSELRQRREITHAESNMPVTTKTASISLTTFSEQSSPLRPPQPARDAGAGLSWLNQLADIVPELTDFMFAQLLVSKSIRLHVPGLAA